MDETEVVIPQVRKTHGVLGAQLPDMWGLMHGVNDQGVAAGCTQIRTRLSQIDPCLTGPDLVRLALERSHSAIQAMEILTVLIARYGQGNRTAKTDTAFLVTDEREAFVIEACGRAWVSQEVGRVRAVSDVCTIRQDWDALSGGLADLAIQKGWWPADGTKLDFAGALGMTESEADAMRRWGRATLHLEEQNGHIDGSYLRRMLGEHDEHFSEERLAGWRHDGLSGAASLTVQLTPGSVPLAWWCYGPPHRTISLPIPIIGEVSLAPVLRGDGFARLLDGRDDSRRSRTRAPLDGLQALWEVEAADFLAQAAAHRALGDELGLAQRAAAFSQRCWAELLEVCGETSTPQKRINSEVPFAVF